MYFRELNSVETGEFIDKGYGFDHFMGGIGGKYKHAIIMSVNGRNYFVDDFEHPDFKILQLAMKGEAVEAANYNINIG